jgi:parallel beta-helix repeat protein/predicted outer membrane repeat protein
MAGQKVVTIWFWVLVCLGFCVQCGLGESLWHVDDDAVGDPASGNPAISDPLEDGTVAHPFDSIQEAINTAIGGDTVIVADGTYRGNGNRDIDFKGKTIHLRSVNGPWNCIIDSQYLGRGFHFHRGENADSILDGFTITKGYMNGGGIRCEDHSSPTIINCILAGNSAVYDGGGGISITNSNPTLTNCIIRNNSAGFGGGILCFNSAPLINNCNITYNNTGIYGGGIKCFSDSRPKITNCILWGNVPDQIEASGSSIAYVTYSNIQEGRSGAGNINTDPLFAFAMDYHLAENSPCIDAGTNSPPGGLTEYDLDGNFRSLDGNEDTHYRVDMGVFEFNPYMPSIALSVDSLDFFMPEGESDTEDQIVSIRNCGGRTLKWEMIEDCTWLEILPASGISYGEPNDIIFRTSQSGLSHGDYVCQVQVVDNEAVNSGREIKVTLHVNASLLVPTQYQTIQAAIDDAVERDVVLIADGIYTGPGNRDLDFLGKVITVQSQNGPENCIIDCEGTELEPHRGFYFYNHENVNSIIDGLTIMNGYAPQAQIVSSGSNLFTHQGGGAVFCYRSSPLIFNCRFINNIAEGAGGAINVWQSDAVINGCIIESNTALGGGGIGCSFYGAPTIRNCIIAKNKAFDNQGGWLRGGGGGIYSYSATTITNCVIAENESYGGGGICTAGDNFGGGCLKITHCTFAANNAEYGGAIYCAELSSSHATNCIFWGNNATFGSQFVVSQIDWRARLYIDYNNIQGLTEELYQDYPGAPNWGVGNIEVNPRFVDAESGNYHLMRDSLCIDAGCDTGVYEDIEGNDRPWDCPWVDHNGLLEDFDMGAYEFVAVETELKFTPRTLNCRSHGKWVKTHLTLPAGYTINDVDPNKPVILEPLDLVPDIQNVYVNEEGRVVIKASFDRRSFCDAMVDWPDQIFILGQFTNGDSFYAQTFIRVIEPGLKDIAELTSRWLQTGCKKPHWCDGMDINQDSIVNLVDFTLLKNGYVEFVSP